MTPSIPRLPLRRTCREVTDLLIARQDRCLPLSDQWALRLHLRACDACPVVERQLRLMDRALKQWRHYGSEDEPAP